MARKRQLGTRKFGEGAQQGMASGSEIQFIHTKKPEGNRRDNFFYHLAKIAHDINDHNKI